MKRSDVYVNKLIDVSRSTASLIDNIPVFSSEYPLLESLSIKTSDLKYNPLHVIKLKSLSKKITGILDDKKIEMDNVCLGGRGKD